MWARKFMWFGISDCAAQAERLKRLCISGLCGMPAETAAMEEGMCDEKGMEGEAGGICFFNCNGSYFICVGTFLYFEAG